MSFDDLPSDWPTRPLTDPTIARDVVDLVVRESDRESGSLTILLCDETCRMIQPITIGELGGTDLPASERRRPFDLVVRGLAERLGGLVVAIGRPHGLEPDDEARAWHEAAIASCRELDVPLLATYLATDRAVVEMPVWDGLAIAG